MKPAPKPTKKLKAKKPKSKGICPSCGFIFQGREDKHFPHCEKEFSPIIFIKNKTNKQMYESALDVICRAFVEWRDGVICVLSDVDGAACSTIPNWSHVIPQGGSAVLVYEPSNWFRGCSAHNIIHDKVNPEIYLEWYRDTFGSLALRMLKQSQIDNRGKHLNDSQLFDRLNELNELYSMRYSFGSATKEEKVIAGYYGSIIREAWIKEGRI